MDSAHEIQSLSHFDRRSRPFYIKQLADNSSSIEASMDAVKGLGTADALYSQAHAKRSKADDAGALSALDTAAESQPEDARLYLERAAVKMCLSIYAEALQDLQTLIDMDRRWGVVNVLNMCGVCQGELGQLQEA